MAIRTFLSKRAISGWAVLLTFILWLTILPSASARPMETPVEEFLVPGELLIGLEPGSIPLVDESSMPAGLTGIPSVDALNRKYNVYKVERLFPDLVAEDTVAKNHGLAGVLKLIVPQQTDISTMAREYQGDAHVEYAEPNWVVELLGKVIPNDPKFKNQWALNNGNDADIDAPEAWAIEKGDEKILVAIIDTGVNYKHQDLDDGRVRTDIDKDFINNDNDAMDDHGHGTYVAGIAAADTNNKTGIAGVCWNCRILPIKVLDSKGFGSAESVSKGIQYAAEKGAHVINMSLGVKAGCGCSKTIAKTINYAWDKGCLLIAASGNDSHQSLLSYPASSPRVVAVGATDKRDRHASFSNQGQGLDVVAPGVKIQSLWLGNWPWNRYRSANGTSAAAPHVSGVAGLVFSHNPALKAGQVWWILQHSADDLGSEGWDKTYGWGRVNAWKALTRKPEGSVDPPTDTCDEEPGCCTVSIALEEDQQATPLTAMLRLLRDKTFTESPVGQRWIQLYYRHTVEVASMLLFDADLRAEAGETLKMYAPLFRALLQGDAHQTDAVFTGAHVTAFYTLMERIANRGSAPLRMDIVSELERLQLERFVGMEAWEMWNRLNAEAVVK